MPVYAAIMNISVTPQGGVSIGGTCGPDVTVPLMNTIRDVEQTFANARPNIKKNAELSMFRHPWEFAKYGWDIDKLHALGGGHYGDNPIYNEDGNALGFGPGSTLGTGSGEDTVQFSYGGLKVYHASGINFILWGKMMSLMHEDTGNSIYSEENAEAAADAEKSFGYGQFFGSYNAEARAFTRFGYFGSAGAPLELFPLSTDPSSSALPFKPDPNNKAAPTRFKWRWMGLHDNYE